MPKLKQATVQRTVTEAKTEVEGLSLLKTVCEAGKQCPEVQNAPLALQALTGLQSAVTAADASLTAKMNLAASLVAAIKLMYEDYHLVLLAARSYEAAVAGIAKGSAVIINKAGLKARLPVTTTTVLGKVTLLNSKAGKHPAEALLTWRAGPGATGYAIEVNFTPQSPSGPWAALTSGTGRRRTVKGPVPGCQFLARVASLGSDGTQSEWSDPILCTAAF